MSEFSKFLEKQSEQNKSSIHVSMLCRLVRLTNNNTRATVQPLYKDRNSGESLPLLSGLPIISDGTLELEPGDTVFVVFNDFPLDEALLSDGRTVTPESKRLHDITDGVVIGKISSTPSPEPNIKHTEEGGLAIKLTNNTGATTVKGSVVAASASDNGFRLTNANSVVPVGIVYDSGVPDGEDAWIVVSGIAQVLMRDNHTPIAGDWVGVSDTTGRAYTAPHSGSTPPQVEIHFREVGHCLESKDAGTDVLVNVVLHFN